MRGDHVRAERDTLGCGPGRQVAKGLEHRRMRVAECLTLGAPIFETVAPVGYDKPIVRCTRCKTLKRQHGA